MTALTGKLRDFANWNDPATFPDRVVLQGPAGQIIPRSADVAPLFASLDVSDPVIAELSVVVSLRGKDFASVPHGLSDAEENAFIAALPTVDLLLVSLQAKGVTSFGMNLDGTRSISHSYDNIGVTEAYQDHEGVGTVSRMIEIARPIIDHYLPKAA